MRARHAQKRVMVAKLPCPNSGTKYIAHVSQQLQFEQQAHSRYDVSPNHDTNIQGRSLPALFTPCDLWCALFGHRMGSREADRYNCFRLGSVALVSTDLS